jgi:3-methyladenine DNA glycosylase AlkD
MNKSEVLSLLKQHENEKGIKNWNEMEFDKCQYKSFGIGLTVHRKLAKQIGKDHELALKLWDSKIYDLKVLSVLMDDPKLITKEQMEFQVEDIDFGLLVHVFSACGAPTAKTPFIVELANEWLESSDPVRKRCAYGFIYEISKSKKKNAPDDEYFLKHINYIDESFVKEDKTVYMSMSAALMGMGKRNLKLNQAAIKVAKNIGPIPVETGKTQCEPFDVSKHLTSEYLTNKFKSQT